MAPGLFGLGTIFQLVPFQCSTSVFSAELSNVLVNALPTATQNVALVQCTLASPLTAMPAGFGLGAIDQLVPL